MSRKKLFFIYNPVSGKGKIKQSLADVLDVFVRAGYIVETRPTLGSGDAKKIISTFNIQDFDRVVCSGGDGTLDQVVAGMISRPQEERIPIGYLPTGSTNDYANSLGIPTNPIEAAKNAVNGQAFTCDIGMLDNKPFIYVAAFGAFTEVSYATDQNLKNVLGHFAYVLKGAESLKDIKGVKLNIESKEKNLDGKYILGLVTNSKSVGGFHGIIDANRVEFDDGKFEVTLIKKPRTPFGINSIVSYLLGTIPESRYVQTFSTDEIKVKTQDGSELSWTVDGEYGGSYSEVTAVNINKEFTIIVPKKTLPLGKNKYFEIKTKKD